MDLTETIGEEIASMRAQSGNLEVRLTDYQLSEITTIALLVVDFKLNKIKEELCRELYNDPRNGYHPPPEPSPFRPVR